MHALHSLQRAISIIGKTLAHFDDDGIIPAYGFGDTVSPLNPEP